jgi:hypothetical protein
MSQRALRSRTVDTVSEEMDLGSQERSPDLKEIITEGVRLVVNEEDNEAKVSQSVLDAEVPNLQTDSSDKNKDSKGNKTPSSQMTMVMNMMQQLLSKTNQQILQEMKGGQKQTQEKTDQKFEELKEGLKDLAELKKGKGS